MIKVMEHNMGIRSIFLPFAFATAVVLKKKKVSISSIVWFSFSMIFLSISSFYFTAATFYAKWFEIVAILGIFFTGFIDEVIRELSRMKKLPQFPLVLARHSDLLLVFGVLYISMVQPYGLIPTLNIGSGVYPAIGLLMLAGVVTSDLIARKMEKRDPGIESRAERMFLLTAFLLVGIYFDNFMLAIFIGLLGVTISLYTWIIWTKVNFYDFSVSIGNNLSKLQRGAYQAGAKISNPKSKENPEVEEIEKEDTFQEFGGEDYGPSSGHNFIAVVNDEMTEPVSNAGVFLKNVDTGETYDGYSDPTGRARFSGISEGQYTITLNHESYKKSEFERYISMDSGEVFVLKKPYSDLSVVITDEKATVPVPNAEVSLKPVGNHKPAVVRSADNLGVAYFSELDVKNYEICVQANGHEDWGRIINLDEETVVSVNLKQGTRGAGFTEAVERKASFPDAPNGSMLLEYTSPEDAHASVAKAVDEYKKHGMDIFLATTKSGKEKYKDLSVETIDLIPSEPTWNEEKFK
ncbi:MAG: MFS transporter, partial [Candidatus Hydrothermarchaeaceae archaeon]